MEGVIQKTPSQNKPLNVNIDNLKNPKPPLLPKPQLIKLESKYHKVGTTNTITSQVIINREEIVSQDRCMQQNVTNQVCSVKFSRKPPSISPKPKLPVKSVGLASLRCDIHSNSQIPYPQYETRQSSLEDKAPSKPPRLSCKKGEDEENPKQDFVEDKALSPNWILSRKKSASLGRNEDLNWTIKSLIKNPKQLSDFCKQVENCSKHSHILRKELQSPESAHRWKRKLNEELDLASFSYLRSNAEPAESKNVIIPSCENGFENHIRNISSGEGSVKFEIPKSFLHSVLSNSNNAKELVKEEKVPEKNFNAQSFLHKNKERKSVPKLSKSCSLGQHNSEGGEGSLKKGNGACKYVDDKVYESKKSENSPRPSSSDITSFGKRFPWFGSFGKGNKKDSAKKERCCSQFYSNEVVVEDDAVLREKNRAKSLPNIKQTRTVPDGVFSSERPEVLRISGEFPHSDSDDDKDSLNQMEFASDRDSNTLAYLKAKEFMTSEEVFIDVLKLLNVDFRNYVQVKNFENKNTCIPAGEINKILNHLSQLQSLNEDILEDLKKRIENWEKNPKIADVIVKKGAFLKMYTTYIQNFESQTNYLDECTVKYPKFGKILKEFEATDRCRKLSLKHYMLKPVQRIPQYRLLLNDYLKHLNESSEDYADTLSALKIVCEVVDHANRNVALCDKEGRLMHFQSLLSDFELIKPGRELVKDGPLEKICRKTVKDRYFILLNDCLLHTTYSKQYLKIHQELPLSGMKICCNDDQKDPPSFTVHSITKSFILCSKNQEECREWVETLQKTIEEHIKRQKTFLNVKIEEDTSFKLGKEAPVWVQDSKVTMCQICTAEFTALFRRHHCRGCGKVVCRNCGSNQAPLQYRNFKPDRVCDQCYELLFKEYEDSESSVCEMLKLILNLNHESVLNEYLSIKAKFIKYSSAGSWKKQKYIPPRLKEVSANDSQSVISGWLYRKSRKSWKLFWYVLKDHVLYMYKASEDVLASDTIPVLGYQVERASVNVEDIDKQLIFSLVHPRQAPIVFRADSELAANKWYDALSAATNLTDLTL